MTYRPSFRLGEFRANTPQFFLPNEEGKTVLYTYIRKNACTSFKRLMLMKARRRVWRKQPDLRKIREFRVKPPVGHFDHSIFVWRDPFERAVSTYVNKFVQRSGNEDIFNSFQDVTGKDPISATFRDFIDYLQNPFSKLDPHAWPQKSHLLEIEYSFPIEMKELARVMREEFPSIAPYFQKPVNKSSQEAELEGDLCDVPANDITISSSENFSDVRSVVEEIYASDKEMISEIRSVQSGMIC
ncbi:sulfotransferase family 2 domain-containing protein [Celeribacter halophilus]|uniref:Sulfotransferase family 2 domain-containing protein n=1 Tax=Celeribacter halophilus TaxID=576117 RepID=A0AAW7Y2D2_9RHOB|nr:sulfotransferase family 2 domain-containing protein [Celeribacter halophilus]MDO6459000.1 sulfotransferase family 2 domain-containing protein [Celeribacter halophilus]